MGCRRLICIFFTGPSISSDGLELYFAARNRTGGYGSDDIWVTCRATKNDPWEPPNNLGPVVNTSASEDGPFLSSNGLILTFLDEWHCVGLTWDGLSNLLLYIDGVEAAKNTQSGIPSSSGNFYIGTGKSLEPGTYWSGLIDDVLIYNRALSAEQIAALTY